MTGDLFGTTIDPDAPHGFYKRHRGPKGGKHYVRKKGYAAPPGTGPEGKTCKGCKHAVRKEGGARFFSKCGLNRARWTCGSASDILLASPACQKFEDAKP